MEEIIKQIREIDQTTLQTKEKNEEIIKHKRNSYEEQLENYKKEKMQVVEEKANEVYEQIIAQGKQQYILQEEKAKKLALLIENKYIQVENALLEKVFEQLFAVEG